MCHLILLSFYNSRDVSYDMSISISMSLTQLMVNCWKVHENIRKKK